MKLYPLLLKPIFLFHIDLYGEKAWSVSGTSVTRLDVSTVTVQLQDLKRSVNLHYHGLRATSLFTCSRVYRLLLHVIQYVNFVRLIQISVMMFRRFTILIP